MIRVFRLIAVCALAASAACSSSSNPSTPTVNVPFSATDLTVGTGATATPGTQVTVAYALWLYNTSAADNKGQQIQSGTFPYTVGAAGVIAGFDQGVTGMKVGGKRRIVVPPTLGYGNNPPSGSGIPANATLLFEVTLLSIP
jgi:FKBP-type peptidyl-prolyl cis-trans isomerase